MEDFHTLSLSPPESCLTGMLDFRVKGPDNGEAVMVDREQYVGYMVGELGRQEETIRTYLEGLDRLERFAGKPVEEVTVADARRFLRESDYRPLTKRSVIVALRSFHQWGALEGHWPLNGIMALRGPRCYVNPLPPLMDGEARTLLSACTLPTEFRLVYLGLYAGTRIAESAAMTAEHWKGDRLHFVGKGGKARTVPVHPELEAVRDFVLGEPCPCSPNGLQHAQVRLSKRSGVPFVSHALRRTFASSLYEIAPREVVGQLLGHGDTVTGRYAPPTMRMMTEAISRLSY